LDLEGSMDKIRALSAVPPGQEGGGHPLDQTEVQQGEVPVAVEAGVQSGEEQDIQEEQQLSPGSEMQSGYRRRSSAPGTGEEDTEPDQVQQEEGGADENGDEDQGKVAVTWEGQSFRVGDEN